MNNNQAIIDMLRADMRDEHAAIVQYLQHAYALGESGEACEIEGIARDEMRHLDWLAEAIVDLGGDPDMKRGVVDLEGAGPIDWMARDVAAEERAISQYEQHLAAIDDPKIKRLLERILSDERAHHGDFEALSDELAAEGDHPPTVLEARTANDASPAVLDVLQTGVEHEYTVILQYLYHNFVMPDCEVGRELEMQAINEMQHMGWLSEEIADLTGHPRMEHSRLELKGSPAEMLQADIKAEKAVERVYTRQIDELDDEDLKVLIARIRDHETYHAAVFEDLLEHVESSGEAGTQSDEPVRTDESKPPESQQRFTVGSLMKK
ncbi:MAG: ferritin-like domain-containing protein [Chloroflexi bacterium]|nr:ferritin-like domain-containing protein [Chloroflexota bacterium]